MDKEEVYNWSDEEAYKWLHDNDATVITYFGNNHCGDGHTVQVVIKSPIDNGHITGCTNNTRASIYQCIKGVAYLKRNKGEYIVDDSSDNWS